jgi:hypothetical protein
MDHFTSLLTVVNRYVTLVICCFVVSFPISVSAQGDHVILFSSTGDTLMTRTSCYCIVKDTFTTYFNILENTSGQLRLMSVFVINEPHKTSMPCADFSLVPEDTLWKYGLYHQGLLGNMPTTFKITSRITQKIASYSDQGEKIYYRQIRHRFQMGKNTFYRTYVWDVAKKKKEPPEKPKVQKVFGSTALKKYHFVVIIKDVHFDPLTGKKRTSITHTRILN